MGVYLYRATAECDACGKVVDVGPFNSLTTAVHSVLEGWLTSLQNWTLRDEMGQNVMLCPACMERPLRPVLADVDSRRAQKGV